MITLKNGSTVKNVTEVKSARYTEKLDGTLTLDMTLDGSYRTFIHDDTLVSCEGQYFDVASYSYSQMGYGVVVEVICEHVSYRLNEAIGEGGLALSNQTPQAALATILSGSDFTADDSAAFNVTGTYTIKLHGNTYYRNGLYQLAALCSGEIYYSGWKIGLSTHRGSTDNRNVVNEQYISDVEYSRDVTNDKESVQLTCRRDPSLPPIGSAVTVTTSLLGSITTSGNSTAPSWFAVNLPAGTHEYKLDVGGASSSPTATAIVVKQAANASDASGTTIVSKRCSECNGGKSFTGTFTVASSMPYLYMKYTPFTGSTFTAAFYRVTRETAQAHNLALGDNLQVKYDVYGINLANKRLTGIRYDPYDKTEIILDVGDYVPDLSDYVTDIDDKTNTGEDDTTFGWYSGDIAAAGETTAALAAYKEHLRSVNDSLYDLSMASSGGMHSDLHHRYSSDDISVVTSTANSYASELNTAMSGLNVTVTVTEYDGSSAYAGMYYIDVAPSSSTIATSIGNIASLPSGAAWYGPAKHIELGYAPASVFIYPTQARSGQPVPGGYVFLHEAGFTDPDTANSQIGIESGGFWVRNTNSTTLNRVDVNYYFTATKQTGEEVCYG